MDFGPLEFLHDCFKRMYEANDSILENFDEHAQ